MLGAGYCCIRRKLRVPSKTKLSAAFGDSISSVIDCIFWVES
jgi:hypothetical protein